MKKFFKYVIGVFWAINACFATSFVIVFALWLMIKKAPTLVGWSAFGTIIGAITILVLIIDIIVIGLWQLFYMEEDHEFVSWLLNSEDEKMREIYRTWLDERRE